jgi:hypothetical protein
VRGISTRDLERLGSATVNILREPALQPVGEDLRRRFGTPYVDSFPAGLSGTCRFLEEVGRICGIDASDAVEEERAYQKAMLEGFRDMAGSRVCFQTAHPMLGADPAAEAVCTECARALDLTVAPDGVLVPFPTRHRSGPRGSGGCCTGGGSWSGGEPPQETVLPRHQGDHYGVFAHCDEYLQL